MHLESYWCSEKLSTNRTTERSFIGVSFLMPFTIIGTRKRLFAYRTLERFAIRVKLFMRSENRRRYEGLPTRTFERLYTRVLFLVQFHVRRSPKFLVAKRALESPLILVNFRMSL